MELAPDLIDISIYQGTSRNPSRNPWNKKSEEIKPMTLKERLIEIISEKKSVERNELVKKFKDRKKELFNVLQDLVDSRKIGISVIVGQDLQYFLKN